MGGRFHPGEGPPLGLDQALALIETRLAPVTAIETVPLAAALARPLAEDVVATRPLPPHDNSAMDGWAVRLADLPPDFRLPVWPGRAAAGHPLPGGQPPGHAVRILTGAVLPDGADAVAMQEECHDDGDVVGLPPKLAFGANIRRTGEDVAPGTVALTAGTRLGPQHLAMAAALGRDRLAVRRRLRVALFATGDELHPPGTIAPAEMPPGALYDSNRPMVAALLTGLGTEVTDLGLLPDRRADITAALAAAAGAYDLIVTSGGVSVGDEDHVKAALEQAGGALHFWRLAVKPGRPLALGEIGATAFAGLPGNPSAAMITFLMLVRPLVLRLAGMVTPPPRRFPLPAAFSLTRRPGRREFLRARVVVGPDGAPAAMIADSDSSGRISPLVWADGLVDIAADRDRVVPGDIVGFIPFSEVLS